MAAKTFLGFYVLMSLASVSTAQKFTTEKSNVTFFSSATIEDIKAENIKSVSIYNQETSDVAFSIPIKDFEFDKSLMKEHFNEKYMDTEKYPKATFQGKFSGFGSGTGAQRVQAKGKLTIHGVTREVEIPGTMEWVAGKINAMAKFKVKLEDYKIKIPQLLWQNIAEEVEVTVEFTYKPI
jgi:hypothetical protein